MNAHLNWGYLEHAGHYATQVVHDGEIAVLVVRVLLLIQGYLINALVAHLKQRTLVHGEVREDDGVLVNPLFERLKDLHKAPFEIFLSVLSQNKNEIPMFVQRSCQGLKISWLSKHIIPLKSCKMILIGRNELGFYFINYITKLYNRLYTNGSRRLSILYCKKNAWI